MDKEILDSFILSGKICSEAREYGKSLIKEGESLLEVTKKIEQKILSMNGRMAFPPQISKNAIAAHYCAKYKDDTIFSYGDIIKLDLGVEINGYVTDTAVTVYLGDDENIKRLVEASRKALENALRIVKPGVKTSEIGREIENTIKEMGFNPIKNLSGHGVGRYDIHSEPNIPNFDTRDSIRLNEDQLIAIEPFATRGIGLVSEKEDYEIFMQQAKKPVRNLFTRQVLDQISTYNGLPFAKRWLIEKFNEFKVNIALKELLQLNIIKPFGPLVERSNNLVSQAEHTVIVSEHPIVLTK